MQVLNTFGGGDSNQQAEDDLLAIARAEIAQLRVDLAAEQERSAEHKAQLAALREAAPALSTGPSAQENATLRAALEVRLRQPDLGLAQLQQQAQAVSQSPLFDAKWYAQTYLTYLPEVDPALHYCAFGAFVGCDPSANFDTIAYYTRNPDVGRAGIAALAHYEVAGRAEQRALK